MDFEWYSQEEIERRVKFDEMITKIKSQRQVFIDLKKECQEKIKDNSNADLPWIKEGLSLIKKCDGKIAQWNKKMKQLEHSRDDY